MVRVKVCEARSTQFQAKPWVEVISINVGLLGMGRLMHMLKLPDAAQSPGTVGTWASVTACDRRTPEAWLMQPDTLLQEAIWHLPALCSWCICSSAVAIACRTSDLGWLDTATSNLGLMILCQSLGVWKPYLLQRTAGPTCRDAS